MQLWNVSYEANHHAATVYLAGLLTSAAAIQAEEALTALPDWIRFVRVDMRAVDLLEPTAFVELARALNRWRDERRGRVSLEFPARAARRGRPQLVRTLSSATIRSNGTGSNCGTAEVHGK